MTSGYMPSQNFSCLSCKVSFTTSESQRNHYKSEWHRYNLKRKTSGLSSICKEEFDDKSVQYYSKPESTLLEKEIFHCPYCGLNFNSKNRLDNHLRSGKHDHLMDHIDTKDHDIENVSKEMDVESVLDLMVCLFCPHISQDIMNNVNHMTSKHNFFVPDVEYLEDLHGLITFCSEKIKLDWICLHCDCAFNSMRSVQDHMISKGHTMIGDADMDDIRVFFDFSSVQDTNMTDDVQDALIAPDETELVFPSGKRVGHREFHRYYKQNLVYRTQSSIKSIELTLHESNEEKSVSCTSECVSNHHKIDKTWLRQLALRMVKLGVSGNRLQKHFRHQIR